MILLRVQKHNKSTKTNHCDSVPPLAMPQLLWQQLHVPNQQPGALHVMLGHKLSVSDSNPKSWMPYSGWINEFKYYIILQYLGQGPKVLKLQVNVGSYRNWDDVTGIHTNVMSLWDILSRRSQTFQENQQGFIFHPKKKKTEVYCWGTSADHVDNDYNPSGQISTTIPQPAWWFPYLTTGLRLLSSEF